MDTESGPKKKKKLACVVQHWFQLSNRSLISQATPFTDEACKTNCLLGGMESCWRERLGRVLSHCSRPSRKFQHVTCVLGSLAWASAIGDAKQTTSEGKSGQVETGLTRPAAMWHCQTMQDLYMIK